MFEYDIMKYRRTKTAKLTEAGGKIKMGKRRRQGDREKEKKVEN